MIGRIRGTLADAAPPDILVDVGGVGYELQVPMTTLYALPPAGGELSLFTHLLVREDAQRLYGFSRERERDLFRRLIGVNGVGPRLALAVLSGMDSEDFVRCVQRKDASALVKLPGIGKKTADLLLVAMEDRVAAWEAEAGGGTGTGTRDRVAEAAAALVALGYRQSEANKAIAAVNDGSGLPSEELIRRALRSMVKG